MLSKIYEVPYNAKCVVYLLIDNDEVVYVGKTEKGIRRIYQHIDKSFNKMQFIEVKKDELDFFEDLYIMKYQPKYNKIYSCIRLTLSSAYSKMGYEYKKKKSFNEFKKILNENNIEIKEFKGKKTILKKDFEFIKNLEKVN